MVEEIIKNKIIDFINKYFRIDMDDDLYFVKTFFLKSVVNVKEMDITALKEYLAIGGLKYYEYDFNGNIELSKKIILDKNKFVVSENLKRGYVYNQKYDRLCIFDGDRTLFRFFDKYNESNSTKYEIHDHDLIKIAAEKKVVDERYTTRLKNPSEAYKFIIEMLYVQGFYYSRGDMDYKKFNEITKEEKDVLIDIVLDLNSYLDLLIKDAFKYLYDERIHKLYDDIALCSSITEPEKGKYAFDLFEKTYDSKYKEVIEYGFKCGEYRNISDWKISDDDYNHYIKLMIMCSWEWTRRSAVRDHLDKYSVSNLTDFANQQIDMHIISVKNRILNYEKWAMEFASARNIDNELLRKWMKEYSNKMWIKDILLKVPTANKFSLDTSRWVPEMTEEEIEEYGLPDFSPKYLGIEKILRSENGSFDEKTSEYRAKARDYFKKYIQHYKHFEDTKYDFNKKYKDNVDDDPLKIYSLELEYSIYMKEILINQYQKNGTTGIDVLDRNLIETTRMKIWRDKDPQKRRRYYFKLNEETRNWLINKEEFYYDDPSDLSNLILYENDEIKCYYAFYDEESGKNDIYIFEK